MATLPGWCRTGLRRGLKQWWINIDTPSMAILRRIVAVLAGLLVQTVGFLVAIQGIDIDLIFGSEPRTDWVFVAPGLLVMLSSVVVTAFVAGHEAPLRIAALCGLAAFLATALLAGVTGSVDIGLIVFVAALLLPAFVPNDWNIGAPAQQAA